jgi:3-methyl-2-oxobutanoate hydroxymethyltransferase
MKRRGERIPVLTCYDVLFARILEEAAVDLILVGDSLGQVVLGHDSTLPVTLDAMIHHAAAVRRGAPGTFLAVDLPFLTYQISPEEALRNAGRVMVEAGADAVKVEGGGPRILEVIERLVGAGIPVMGHLGLTPQSVHTLGGFRVQAREEADARQLREEALALEAAGCFSLVLELIPGPLAEAVTRELTIPTIGIGAGPGCDGQVLVLPDALGLNPGFTPRFLRRFADLHGVALEGVRAYLDEVRSGSYPAPEHTVSGDPR